MTQEILRHMNLKLKELLPYQFYEWRTKAEYPYWIGEYSETPDTSEDGSGEDVMMITGTTKGSVMDLENGKEVLHSGTHIIAYYDTSTMIPTDGNDINRIQVNLKIKSWKVNE